MKRFPTRTVVLMGLALVSFAWFWWQTHRPRPVPAEPNAPSERRVKLPDVKLVTPVDIEPGTPQPSVQPAAKPGDPGEPGSERPAERPAPRGDP